MTPPSATNAAAMNAAAMNAAAMNPDQKLDPAQEKALAAALADAERNFPDTIARLKQLVRIPSCSFPGFDPAHVLASAEDTRAWLLAAGYPEARIVHLDVGAGKPPVHPYVLAKDHRAGPCAPTILLYAHHDVQPPLREHLWRTKPFDPVEIDGRLYARGAADDKAGILCHAASAAAWNRTAGRPPVNLTVLIEGEEEIGSHHLTQFMDAHAAELRADVLLVADLANYDIGLPSVTTSLRGLVAYEVELRALKSPLHSGMWGGTVTDPTLALCKLLATLTDADGRIAVPGILDRVLPPTAAEIASWKRLPYDAALLGRQSGRVRGTPPADAVNLHRALWREPALSVNAIQAGERGRTGNVIMDCAWARVGLRIVPDMRPAEIAELLAAWLKAHAPADCELTLTAVSDGSPWVTAVDHPVFSLASAALARGFGREPVFIGCGASIPFVGDLTARLGGIPALLIGVEDPWCGAHAENESVHLGDLRSALRSQITLYALLAAATARPV